MAKILKDADILEIVTKAVKADLLDCSDQYEKFLGDLAEVVADHFGGERGEVEIQDGEWYVPFTLNECVPPDGGVYADYDKAKDWTSPAEDLI